jgi:stage III sporulation protein AH
LQTLQGELQNARDQVIGKGYKDCVIMPLGDYSKVAVYVKADKLTPEQAVQIMHIVSEQLNISAANVSVQIKS